MVRDVATLWAAFKRQKSMVSAGELDSMQMLEWIGAVEHNVKLDIDALTQDVDDDAVHLLIIFANSIDTAGRFLRSNSAAKLVASDRLCNASKLELFHHWAAGTDHLSGACIEAVLPVLAHLAQSTDAGTALGYFGEYDIATVACTCLYHVVSADECEDLLVKADELGMVDAIIAIAKPLLGSQDDLVSCYKSGVSTTILDTLRRQFAEKLLAALGVEDLQMALLPDSYWE